MSRCFICNNLMGNTYSLRVNKSNKDDLVIVENWHEFKNYPDIKEKFTNIVFKSCKNILLVTNSYHFLKDSQIWRKIDD